jgi:hypothetical protein
VEVIEEVEEVGEVSRVNNTNERICCPNKYTAALITQGLVVVALAGMQIGEEKGEEEE